MHRGGVIPVAAYVRMSTDDQQLSIANQEAAIQKYAAEHDFAVVVTYSDAGKSGLVLQHRKGLRTLLRDVTSGNARFRAILVYDVSRWGRFQDVDEAGHYEYLCKQSGIPVHYCAEPFVNDGALPSSIVKALKRSMAAEYSRELSVKVSAGKVRLANLGYWMSGRPGYGLRRVMVSSDGKRSRAMQNGEHKSLHSYHTILVPGPKKEVRWVKKIYQLYIDGMGATAIANYLNSKRVRFERNGWDYNAVLRLLRNAKYTGSLVWGKSSGILRSKRLRVPRKAWVVKHQAFPPIIPRSTFDRVQRLLASRLARWRYSEGELLGKLERLLKRKGSLSHRIINDTPGPCTLDYMRHFGSLLGAYRRIGYCAPERSYKVSEGWKRAVAVREALISSVLAFFPNNVFRHRLGRKLRHLLLVDGNTLVSVAICQSYQTTSGQQRWILKLVDAERPLPSLVCLLNDRNDGVQWLYLLPSLAMFEKTQYRYYFPLEDIFLSSGKKLTSLSDFYATAKQLGEMESLLSIPTARTNISRREMTRVISETARRRLSETMRRRWAEAKKQGKSRFY